MPGRLPRLPTRQTSLLDEPAADTAADTAADAAVDVAAARDADGHAVFAVAERSRAGLCGGCTVRLRHGIARAPGQRNGRNPRPTRLPGFVFLSGCN